MIVAPGVRGRDQRECRRRGQIIDRAPAASAEQREQRDDDGDDGPARVAEHDVGEAPQRRGLRGADSGPIAEEFRHPARPPARQDDLAGTDREAEEQHGDPGGAPPSGQDAEPRDEHEDVRLHEQRRRRESRAATGHPRTRQHAEQEEQQASELRRHHGQPQRLRDHRDERELPPAMLGPRRRFGHQVCWVRTSRTPWSWRSLAPPPILHRTRSASGSRGAWWGRISS